MKIRLLIAVNLALALISAVVAQSRHPILQSERFRHYVDYFNRMEDENIRQAIPNDSAWQWMKRNIPLFECPQQNVEEIYYFRWWTLRKHIKQTPQGYVMTEFLVPRSYADKYNLIASALGHHIYESRWLHDKRYMDENIRVWYRGNEGKPLKRLRFYSSWNIDAIYARYLVNGDAGFLKDMYPDLQTDYFGWETEKRAASGLFWQFDVRDAMEETISGGRKEKNERPSINAYMFGNARALSQIAAISGDMDASTRFALKADTIRHLVQARLWNPTHQFFEVRKEQGDTLARVREAIGYLPWYVGLPDSSFNIAWKHVADTNVFCAPFGLTTADRRHPGFRTHGCCKCEWDGPVWPFATSQTLTAMGNVLRDRQQSWVDRRTYFDLFETYVESQYYRGRPYIGEYLDERTGYWLKGDEERSRYYNHSTFNDLVITGIAGLRPRVDDVIEVDPLLPSGKWDWFCLDNVLYHGKHITILWDRDGRKYGRGKGLSLWVDGIKKASSPDLGNLKAKL
jgi:hypothetical protein